MSKKKKKRDDNLKCEIYRASNRVNKRIEERKVANSERMVKWRLGSKNNYVSVIIITSARTISKN